MAVVSCENQWHMRTYRPFKVVSRSLLYTDKSVCQYKSQPFCRYFLFIAAALR